MKRAMRLVVVLMFVAAAALAATNHTMTVNLAYDFTNDNGCATPASTGCLLQFNVYDLTVPGTPVKLLTIPAPAGATGASVNVTGSGAVALKSGLHIFGATAQMADGTESDPNASTVTSSVKPGIPVIVSLTVK